MPAPRLIVCADTVMLDSDMNAVSVINIMDDVTPVGFPFLIPKLAVLSVMTRTDEEASQFQVALRIDLDAQTLFRAESQIDFQGEKESPYHPPEWDYCSTSRYT